MTQHLSLNMFREMFFKVEDRRTSLRSLSSIQFYSYNAKSQSPECDWPTLSKHLVKETLSASWETQKQRKPYSNVTKGGFRVP